MNLRTILKERALDLNIFLNSKLDILTQTCMDLTHSLKKNLKYIETENACLEKEISVIIHSGRIFTICNHTLKTIRNSCHT